MLHKIDELRLEAVLARIQPTTLGAEIGVFRAEFARDILRRWPGTMYLIDPWRPLGEEYQDSSNQGHPHSRNALHSAVKNLRGMEARAIMIRATGAEAVHLFQDASLDWVYIDANHTYTATSQDLRMWWPKVKPGGWLMGHDYLPLSYPSRQDLWIGPCPGGGFEIKPDPLESFGAFGVNPAVDEFLRQHKLWGYLTPEWFGSWLVQKP